MEKQCKTNGKVPVFLFKIPVIVKKGEFIINKIPVFNMCFYLTIRHTVILLLTLV